MMLIAYNVVLGASQLFQTVPSFFTNFSIGFYNQMHYIYIQPRKKQRDHFKYRIYY